MGKVDDLVSESERFGEASERSQITDEERARLRRRLDEIRQQTNPGKLARKLRKRKGLSIEQLGLEVGVDPELVGLFEKSGSVRIWKELVSIDSFFDDWEGENAGEMQLNRFIKALEPNAEEEVFLRHDIEDDLRWLVELVQRFLPPELWDELTAKKPAKDPWENEDEVKPKSRRRTRSRRESLSSLRALGRESTGSVDPPPADSSQSDKGRKALKFKLQLVTMDERGTLVSTVDLTEFDKGFRHLEELGINLSESKRLLAQLQQQVVETQVQAFLKTHRACEKCGKPHRLKGHRETTLRTLFGNVSIRSPRFKHCLCKSCEQASFSPLTGLLTGRTSPELLYMEAKWASLVSYGMSAKALQDFLPVDEKLNAGTVRNHTLAVAERLESELGEEQVFFIDSCPSEWDKLPEPDGPITVGIDGGYLRHWNDRRTNFEAVVGKSVPTRGDAKCFGLVRKLDEKPKRRLFDLLCSQGMQMNQSVYMLSDGDSSLIDLQLYLNPNADHILDWFHIAMRFTGLKQFIKGLVKLEKDQGTYDHDSPAREMQQGLDAAKWKLWHGKVEDALYRLGGIELMMYNFEESYPKFSKLEKAVGELLVYLRRNKNLLRNYAKDRHEGRPISTAFIESLVNSLLNKRFRKKQQMQWSPEGAHLLLQVRTKVLNRELATVFNRWYPSLGLGAKQAASAEPLIEAA